MRRRPSSVWCRRQRDSLTPRPAGCTAAVCDSPPSRVMRPGPDRIKLGEAQASQAS
jgi:hypothetical protein